MQKHDCQGEHPGAHIDVGDWAVGRLRVVRAALPEEDYAALSVPPDKQIVELMDERVLRMDYLLEYGVSTGSPVVLTPEESQYVRGQLQKLYKRERAETGRQFFTLERVVKGVNDAER